MTYETGQDQVGGHGEQGVAWADGQRVPIYNPWNEMDDRSGEDVVNEFCATFGVSQAVAVEMLAFYDRTMAPAKGSAQGAAVLEVLEMFKKAARLVMGYQKRPHFFYQCVLLAFEWYDELGCDNQQKLADRWGVTKASVNKCVMRIQREIGPGLEAMKPGAGQRSLQARQTFRRVRKGQLKKSDE